VNHPLATAYSRAGENSKIDAEQFENYSYYTEAKKVNGSHLIESRKTAMAEKWSKTWQETYPP
jgi:hypothetical protein